MGDVFALDEGLVEGARQDVLARGGREAYREWVWFGVGAVGLLLDSSVVGHVETWGLRMGDVL